MASYVDMAKEVLASMAAGAKAGTPGKPGEIEAVVVPKAQAEPNPAETARLSELAELPPIEQSLPPVEQSLNGRAVELWRDGNRFFLVADDEDALEAMQRFDARRGEVWTRGELELVVCFQDQAIRREIEAIKRQTDGSLSPDSTKALFRCTR